MEGVLPKGSQILVIGLEMKFQIYSSLPSFVVKDYRELYSTIVISP